MNLSLRQGTQSVNVRGLRIGHGDFLVCVHMGRQPPVSCNDSATPYVGAHIQYLPWLPSHGSETGQFWVPLQRALLLRLGKTC